MTTENRTFQTTGRTIYVCRKCKHAVTVDRTYEVTQTWYLGRCETSKQVVTATGRISVAQAAKPFAVCACGGYTDARNVSGRVVETHKCDSRCLNAKTSECECSCGGKNHGLGHIAA